MNVLIVPCSGLRLMDCQDFQPEPPSGGFCLGCKKSKYIIFYGQLLNNFSSFEICLSDEDGKHLYDAKESVVKKILINSIERKVSYWDQLVDSEAAMFHVLGELFRDGIIATIGYSNFSETPCVKSKANTEGTTYERWVRFKIPEWNIQRVSELTFQMKLTQTRWQTQDVSIHSWPLGHSDRVLEAFYRRGDDGVWTIAAVPHFLGAK